MPQNLLGDAMTKNALPTTISPVYPQGTDPETWKSTEAGGVDPSEWLAKFEFNSGDTSASVKSGVSFQSAQALGTPAGQSEQGLDFSYQSTTPENDPPLTEIRFTHPAALETWQKIRVWVPANFYHRQCVGIGVSGDISSWVVGDTVRGVDGTSTGTLWYKAGSTIYLNLADNPYTNEVWIGSITNTTRSQARTSTSRSVEADNNKLFTKWCDGYSSFGSGPTIVWEFSSDGDGGSRIGQQYSAGQNTNTGAHGRAQIYASNFITPDDFGTWMEVIFHVKMSSARGVRNGVIGVYQKKSGASVFTKILEQTEADIGSPVEDVEYTQLAQGYFIGYSNSGYDVYTSFYVSQFWHSTQLPAELVGVI